MPRYTSTGLQVEDLLVSNLKGEAKNKLHWTAGRLNYSLCFSRNMSGPWVPGEEDPLVPLFKEPAR